MIQVFGISARNNQDLMRQENDLLNPIMLWLSNAVFKSDQNKGLMTFKSVSELLVSDEMIYHQIDKNLVMKK